jgi:nitrile hydratase
MKLQHNIGGLEGLGPLEVEKRVFVQPWEKRVFGVHTAMMGLGIWTWTELRTLAEGMNPVDYIKLRYYEKWLGGIIAFLIDKGVLTKEEVEARTIRYLEDAQASLPATGGDAGITERIIKYLWDGDSPLREAKSAPRFAAGEKVRVRDFIPSAHSKLPGFLRGKTGVVEKVYPGNWAFPPPATGPDGISGEPQPIYLVRFEPNELWSRQHAEPKEVVYADLYDTYLEKLPS